MSFGIHVKRKPTAKLRNNLDKKEKTGEKVIFCSNYLEVIGKKSDNQILHREAISLIHRRFRWRILKRQVNRLGWNLKQPMLEPETAHVGTWSRLGWIVEQPILGSKTGWVRVQDRLGQGPRQATYQNRTLHRKTLIDNNLSLWWRFLFPPKKQWNQWGNM